MYCNWLISVFLITFFHVRTAQSQAAEPVLTSAPKSLIDSVPSIRVRLNKYYLNQKKLRTKEAADLLSCVDSSSFVMFNKGHRLQRAGGTVAILGAGLAAVGCIVAMGEAIDNVFAQTHEDGSTGVPVLITSGCLTFGGLLLMTIGKSQKTRSVRLYNHKLRSRAGVVGFYGALLPNGVSLGLRF
jgi:hypothetical protein